MALSGILWAMLIVWLTSLIARATRPLTKEELSDLPHGFYIAERIAYGIKCTTGCLVAAYLLFGIWVSHWAG